MARPVRVLATRRTINVTTVTPVAAATDLATTGDVAASGVPDRRRTAIAAMTTTATNTATETYNISHQSRLISCACTPPASSTECQPVPIIGAPYAWLSNAR